MRIRVNEGFITKDLYKIIFSNKIDEFSAKMSNGSAMKNIPPFADLKGMIADIPSMKEQYCMGNFFLTLIPSLPFINDSKIHGN